MEGRVGIEPTHKGFADLSLTTWVPRLVSSTVTCSALEIQRHRPRLANTGDKRRTAKMSPASMAAVVESLDARFRLGPCIAALVAGGAAQGVRPTTGVGSTRGGTARQHDRQPAGANTAQPTLQGARRDDIGRAHV